MGANQLAVQDYNVTNAPGPAGSSIIVNYYPPSTPVPISNISVPGSSFPTQPSIRPVPSTLTPPLIINSAFYYRAFSVNQPFAWIINLSGGSLPYYLTISWGDGSDPSLMLNTTIYKITHQYALPGNYVIKLSLMDHSGNTDLLQLIAIVKGNSDALGSSSGNIYGSPGSSSVLPSLGSWLWLIWPSYLIIILMLVSFWLGEKQEFRYLKLRRHVSGHKG